MSNQFITQRLNHLEKLIDKTTSLIEGYERKLVFESDPRVRLKYMTEIEELQKMLTKHRNEYDQLRKNATVSDSTSHSDTDNGLGNIENKIDELLKGQDKVTASVDALLSHYETSQRAIIAELTKQINESELADTERILGAIEKNRLSESSVRQLIDLSQLALDQLRVQHKPVPEAAKIEATLSDPSLEVKHKVKLIIPLIPVLLRYEGEIELGNLSQQWQALKKRFRKREPLNRRRRLTLAITFLVLVTAALFYIYKQQQQKGLEPSDAKGVESPSPTPEQTTTDPQPFPSKPPPKPTASVRPPKTVTATTTPQPSTPQPSEAQIKECVKRHYPGEIIVGIEIKGAPICTGRDCYHNVVVTRKETDENQKPTHETVKCTWD